MRPMLCSLLLLLPVIVCLHAGAQDFQTAQPNFWAGTRARDVKFVPIDTTKALQPRNVQAFHPVQQQRAFHLSNIFPKFTMPSWPPRTANVTVLDQKQNVFQPNPPKGFNPFDPPKTK